MCLLGLSVAVDVFTLVCISVERYLAICRPLLILKLQSIDCSGLLNGLILILIWSLGLLTALPNLKMYNLCSLQPVGRFKCEKRSPKEFDERVYMITLLGRTLFLSRPYWTPRSCSLVFYFVIPALVMIFLYTLIIWKMYRSGRATQMRSFQSKTSMMCRSSSLSLIWSGSQTSHMQFHSTTYPSSSIVSKDTTKRVPERVFSNVESEG